MSRFTRSLRKFGAFIKVPEQPIAVYDCNMPETGMSCDEILSIDGFTEPWTPGEILPEWAIEVLSDIEELPTTEVFFPCGGMVDNEMQV